MIANLSPAESNFQESLSTLQFANRAKNIKNKANKFKNPKIARIAELEEEIVKLKQKYFESQQEIMNLEKNKNIGSCKCLLM